MPSLVTLLGVQSFFNCIYHGYIREHQFIIYFFSRKRNKQFFYNVQVVVRIKNFFLKLVGAMSITDEGFAVITVTAIEGTSLFYDDCIVVTENSADYGIMLYAPEITAGIYGLRVHGIVPNNSEKSYLVCAAVYEQGIMKTCTLEEFSAETLRSGDVELSLDYASLPDTFDLKLFLFDSASGVPAAEPYQTN